MRPPPPPPPSHPPTPTSGSNPHLPSGLGVLDQRADIRSHRWRSQQRRTCNLPRADIRFHRCLSREIGTGSAAATAPRTGAEFPPTRRANDRPSCRSAMGHGWSTPMGNGWSLARWAMGGYWRNGQWVVIVAMGNGWSLARWAMGGHWRDGQWVVIGAMGNGWSLARWAMGGHCAGAMTAHRDLSVYPFRPSFPWDGGAGGRRRAMTTHPS